MPLLLCSQKIHPQTSNSLSPSQRQRSPGRCPSHLSEQHLAAPLHLARDAWQAHEAIAASCPCPQLWVPQPDFHLDGLRQAPCPTAAQAVHHVTEQREPGKTSGRDVNHGSFLTTLELPSSWKLCLAQVLNVSCGAWRRSGTVGFSVGTEVLNLHMSSKTS